MDEATAPTVTITSRADPAHNNTIEYTVTGTVFDVRSHRLDNLTLSLDGETKTVPFARNTTPGSVDTFETTITLGDQINTITVTATDPGTVKGDVGKPLRPSAKTGNDTLKLDADRLPDHYEQSVLSTRPLDPDSDSNHTETSEADDGVIDAAEDLDADNATNYREYVLGIDPLNPDTDGDKLLDGFEIWATETAPNATDTDDDNVSDAAEDFEPDGIDNLREQNYSTAPHDPDTDDDNLSDGIEVDQFETEPLTPDTDGDDLGDGTEVLRYGTDPLDVDTDGDNLTDSDELREHGTSPLQVDTDNDNLTDWSEITVYGTNATQADTDEDALTDGQEVDIVTTDPTVADSDSSVTSVDEADDGTVDGAEDFDGDSVRNSREFRIGIEPLTVDTDGDQLRDGFEVRYSGVSPLEVQTDNDTVGDAAENLDGDNLTNLQEQRHETHPVQNDTDDDLLADGIELDVHGTEPTLSDTDEDGLNDSEELDLGTDPTLADTDGDGTIDSNEMFTTSTTDEETGVTLNVTGKGNVAENVTVETDNRSRFEADGFENTTVSKVVEMQSDSDFRSANVTISYNESAISKGSESDLAVYRYNETLKTFVKVNSTVNTRANTVSAETKHFSTYTVLSKEAWRDRFDEPLPSNWTTVDDFDSLANWSCEGDSACTSQNSSVTIGNGPDSSGQSIRSSNTSNNSSTSTICAESISGDSDCDDDGIKNWNDDCPNQYAETSSGCPDSDGDGTVDKNDDCPDEYGEKANDCPEEEDDKDDDNDGVLDKYDDCPDEYGEGPNGCPETDPEETWFNRTISLSENVETIVLRSRLSSAANSDGSLARFVIKAEDGSSKVIHEVSQGPTPEESSQTVEVDISEFSGQEVTLSVYTVGDAYITLYSLDLKRDTDGDGIFDNVETDPCGIRDGLGNCISTDVTEVDSDEDQLDDDREIGAKRRVTDAGKYYTLVSHPAESDTDRDRLFDGEEVIGNKSDPWKIHTDSDGLNDSWEVNGWDVNVSQKDKYGKPYKWNPNSSRNETWNSSAWTVDTDGDGLSDYVEYEETHTNPRANVTYGVTIEHEQQIYDRLATAWEENPGERSDLRETAVALDVLDGRSMDSLDEVQLTDASDDFDFVQPDRGGIVFTALDGEDRTDVWLTNREEVQQNLAPWDPDHDNDGQELSGITTASDVISARFTLVSIRDDSSLNIQTNPRDVDTDGDGYWDGWIGIYGVNRTDNVVLYKEHLRDDDDGDGNTTEEGVQNGEIVTAQVGVHKVRNLSWSLHRPDKVPAGMSVDIDGDGWTEHSNLHVGELQWNENPTSAHETPSPEFTLEVDFYNDSNYTKLDNQAWENGIEQNYALYGIRVDIKRDEVLDNSSFVPCTGVATPPACTYPNDGFSVSELAGIGTRHANEPSDEYLFVADKPQGGVFMNRNETWGINLYSNPTQGLFIENIQNSISKSNSFPKTEMRKSPYRNSLAFVSAAVELHEIGHAFHAGKADDRFELTQPREVFNNNEVYSGSAEDYTPEEINGVQRWSLMRRGWDNRFFIDPLGGKYYVLSVEEATTLKND